MIPQESKSRGVLLGSGFVDGEGLLGVGIALVAVAKSRRPDAIGTEWLGSDVIAMLVGAATRRELTVWQGFNSASQKTDFKNECYGDRSGVVRFNIGQA